MKSNWPENLYRASRIAAIAFVLLMAAAMAVYPGGTLETPRAEGYRFFENSLGDLGRTKTFDVEPNGLALPLFAAAMFAAAVGVGGFFTALAGVMRKTRSSKISGALGAIFGLLAGISFIGVSCCPADIEAKMHLQLVRCAFVLLLLASTLAAFATVKEGRLRQGVRRPFFVLNGILIGYVILMVITRSSGSPNPTLQAIAEKITVGSAMLIMLAIGSDVLG